MIRKVSRRILESLGYAVNEAEDGQEALAKCRLAMPDLVLLDWNMPVMNGIDVLAALRHMEGGSAPKVVFCTTNNAHMDVDRGFSAGANGYVIKPFDERALSAKLQEIGAI